MKGEYLADGCGGWRKPYLSCYVGGGTGVYAIAQAGSKSRQAFRYRAGRLRRKDVDLPASSAGGVYSHLRPVTEQPLRPNLLWIFALEQNRYMQTYGITLEEIARVSVKNKRNAMGHPAPSLAQRLP